MTGPEGPLDRESVKEQQVIIGDAPYEQKATCNLIALFECR
jgi:hypothetical protein